METTTNTTEALPRIEYQELTGRWATPNGKPYLSRFRDGTNDWNTVNACCGTNDEYGLAGLYIAGDVIDVGGYLGSVGIPLAVDNPEARVLIVEPVPDNWRLIEENIDLNEVRDRVNVFHGAAGPKGIGTSEIRFRYVGDTNLEHHAFVGNSSLSYDTGGETPHLTEEVETLGLEALLDRYAIDRVAFLKIDCEGGEWTFLDSPAASRLDRIVGEAHNVRGHRGDEIVALLSATHDVTLYGNQGEVIAESEGTCGFRAVLR